MGARRREDPSNTSNRVCRSILANLFAASSRDWFDRTRWRESHVASRYALTLFRLRRLPILVTISSTNIGALLPAPPARHPPPDPEDRRFGADRLYTPRHIHTIR